MMTPVNLTAVPHARMLSYAAGFILRYCPAASSSAIVALDNHIAKGAAHVRI